MQKTVLLIAPKFIKNVGEYYEFPIGMAYVAASAKLTGAKVVCLNLNSYNESVEMLISNHIIEHKPDLVGIGGLSPFYNNIKNIVNSVRHESKRINLQSKIVVGGGLVGSEPELMTKMLDADIYVTGDGDGAIKYIIEHLDVIPSKTIINGVDHLVAMDDLPMADYEAFGYADYIKYHSTNDVYYTYKHSKPRVFNLSMSRGCPYLCTFCYHPTGNVYRTRKLDPVFKEIEYYIKKFDVNIISVIDELFGVNKANLKEFCERISKYKVNWMCQIRVNQINDEDLKMMVDSGLHYLSLGLESMDQKILDSMKKHITTEQIETALELCWKHNVGIQGNFILGDELEDEKTINNTFNWWMKNTKYGINIGFITAYPGTDLYKKHITPEFRQEFIEKNCPQVNMTKVPSKKFWSIIRQVLEYSGNIWMANKYPSKINLKIINNGENQYKGPMKIVEFDCPKCKSHNKYDNHNMGGFVYMIHCKNCNMKIPLGITIQ